jgi:Annexin
MPGAISWAFLPEWAGDGRTSGDTLSMMDTRATRRRHTGLSPSEPTTERMADAPDRGPVHDRMAPGDLARLQAYAGNRAAGAVAQRLAVQRAIATDQADSIARQLEDAMAGWGTDEDAIYGALSGRTGADLDAIKASYTRLYHKDLDAELRDELNDSEMAHLAQLMPPVADDTNLSEGGRAAYAVDRAKVVASQIRDAIAGLGTEEAQIYGALTGRSASELNEIQRQYLALTGRDVILDLRDDMSGGELKKALALFEVASAGTFQNTFRQEMTEGETTEGQGLYTYALHRDRLDVDVPIKFTPDPGVAIPFALWNGQIDKVWNQFAVTEPGGRKVPINLKMRNDSGADREVVVHNNKNPTKWYEDRANAGEFYLLMKDSTVPHEFGHFIGLQDEYQRKHDDFKKIVGAPPVGPANASGKSALDIAKELHAALNDGDPIKRAPEATRVLTSVGLIVGGNPQQGDFAQDVKRAYDKEYGGWFSKDLVEAMRDKIPERQKWTIQTVFSYASRSLMGDPDGLGGGVQPHDHAVEPRHLRAFASIVKNAWPDFSWTTGPR